MATTITGFVESAHMFSRRKHPKSYRLGDKVKVQWFS